MFRKGMALAFALLFAVGAHLRLVCDVSLAGEPVARGCSLQTVREAERTAAAAAEEILRDDASAPLFERRIRLSFRRPGRETRPLTDALLRATAGVALWDCVSVGGRRLGFVRDGDALREKLRGYIDNTLPAWAKGGTLAAPLTIRRLYTRADYAASEADMLLLITGAAPVFYYDGTGRFARA